MITVDTNAGENSVYDGIVRKAGVEAVVRKRLDVGDVLMTVGEGETCQSFCFERKTWSDLAGSLCDQRFHEQKSRMIDETCQYAYVIEGTLPGWDGNVGSMRALPLWAALVKTALRDKIQVFHTADSEGTAALCVYVFHQLQKGGFTSSSKRVVAGVSSKRKRENLDDPHALLRAMLTNVPGMSPQKADEILKRWATVKELCDAPQTEIENLKCGARRLGPKLAEALKAVFC